MNTSTKNLCKMKMSFLTNATRRTVLFLCLFCIFSFLAFVVGNYQIFLDSSLLFIIRVCAFAGILCIFFSFLGIILSIINLIFKQQKIKCIFSLIVYLVVLVFAIFFVLITCTFDVISSGSCI